MKKERNLVGKFPDALTAIKFNKQKFGISLIFFSFFLFFLSLIFIFIIIIYLFESKRAMRSGFDGAKLTLNRKICLFKHGSDELRKSIRNKTTEMFTTKKERIKNKRKEKERRKENIINE